MSDNRAFYEYYDGWLMRVYAPVVETMIQNRPSASVETLRGIRDRAVRELQEDRVDWSFVATLEGDIRVLTEEIEERWEEERDAHERWERVLHQREPEAPQEETRIQNNPPERSDDHESTDTASDLEEGELFEPENVIPPELRVDPIEFRNARVRLPRLEIPENAEYEEIPIEAMDIPSEPETEDEFDVAEYDNEECAACRVNRIKTTYQPCGHSICCARCGGRILLKKRKPKCPVCRQRIKELKMWDSDEEDQ